VVAAATERVIKTFGADKYGSRSSCRSPEEAEDF
jgi:hypothetical protein